jgi:hypothetical protein
MTPGDIARLAVGAILTGAIALRAFLDRTSGEQSAADKLLSGSVIIGSSSSGGQGLNIVPVHLVSPSSSSSAA